MEPVIGVKRNSLAQGDRMHAQEARCGGAAGRPRQVEKAQLWERGFESAISSFKRVFGEHLTSVKWRYMVNELLLKASVHNMFMSIRA